MAVQRDRRPGAARSAGTGAVRSAGMLAARSAGTGAARREGRVLAQLAVCSGAFVLLVAAKLLIPGQTAALTAALDRTLDRNLDMGRVFSAVGRAFAGEPEGAEEVWQAVFSPLDGASWDGADSGTDSGETGTGTDSATDSGEAETGADSRETSSGGGTAVLTGGTVRLSSVRVRDGAAMEVLRQYRGGGSASPAGSPADGSSDGTSSGTADGTADGSSGGLSGGTAGSPADGSSGGTAGSGSYTAPSGERKALPENVSMEQAILNFHYCTPVLGSLTSGFGWRTDPVQGVEKFHYGLDLAAESGTDVLCFADGTVSAVGESVSYGKYCIVDHAGGFSTLYAHCSRIAADSGAMVSMGQKIGEVGSTGQSTGPHLHFELQKGKLYLNPVYYVAHT